MRPLGFVYVIALVLAHRGVFIMFFYFSIADANK